MAVIQSKKKPVIKAGTNYSYNPDTFMKEHNISIFYETDKAEDVLKLIRPFEFKGRKYLVCDTEAYPSKMKSREFPSSIVRRWIGSGKKATPVDFPFCLSLCDGTHAITLYDTMENDYAEFKKLNEWFLDPAIEFIFHNAKFDMHMLHNIGMRIVGRIHDTVVIAKLANENRYSFQLRDIASKHPKGIIKFEYMVDSYKSTYKVTDYRQIPRELLSLYANADVWNAYWVFVDEYQMLIDDDLLELYEKECKVLIATYAMERHGMNTDPEYEEPLKQDLQEIVDAAEKAVYDAVGYVFNMNSNPQIHKAMLHMGVDPSIFRKTDKGNIKLDKKELARLEGLGIELVVKIQEYRKNEKLLNTYAVGIYDQRDAAGKVHGSINQTEATTGRMSITKPALQTLPKRDTRIRRAFVPSSDEFELWFMDLDQIEYRLLAHYAQARGLIEAIINGHDIHTATAAIIFNKPIEEITEDERQEAKTVNFSLVYGQGDEATSIALKMSLVETRLFKRKYFDSIPEVEPFVQTVMRVTRARGYVRNFYSRRRRLKYDEAYKATNALIQGCAADYIKDKLVLIHCFLYAYKYRTRLINIVHDELLPEVHVSERHLVPKLRWLLSDFETFRVPITAGAEYGAPSWGQKETPKEDVGFESLTDEEMEAVLNYNIYDGSVFDIA